MSEYEIRPRYKFINPRKVNDLNQSLRRAIESEPDRWPLKYKKTQGHLIFSYKGPIKHLWSPEMDLNFEAEEEGTGTVIRVVIGPAAAVWTFFMFLYSIAALILVGGFILSYSQFSLGKEIWGFWLIPTSVFFALGVFLAGFWGKKRARRQMISLKKFFDATLPGSVLMEGNLRI
jgi:hypothetical protein